MAGHGRTDDGTGSGTGGDPGSDTGTGDMSGTDPMSSTAEGDTDAGTAALAEAGTGHADDDRAPGTGDTGSADHATTPPPEAFDDTPVTDAAPEENLGYPDR